MASTAQSPLRERPIQFGKYALLARIASGGMGELFLAQLRSAGGFAKLVVIKRILSHLTDKPEFVDLFVAEARTAARITHPNVCQIYELGQVDGRYYLALEYLEGLPLAEVMVARKKAPQLADLRLVASLIGQVAEGLHHAHSLREPDGQSTDVIHRDVNPRNVFVTSAGVAKVLDFGIVRVRTALSQIQTGAVKGTYSYMAPEQLQGETVDCTADIFSLGTMTWEAVVGRRLFKRSSDLLTWRAIVDEPIPRPTQFRPDLPADLDEVIMRALRRPVAERFQSAREFSAALEQSIRPLGAPFTTLAIAEEMEKAFATELGAQRERVFAAHRRQEEIEAGPAVEAASAPAEPSDAASDGVIDDWFGGGSHTRVADPGYAELVANMAIRQSQPIEVPVEPMVDVPSEGLELTEEVVPSAAKPVPAALRPIAASPQLPASLPRPSQMPTPLPPPAFVVGEPAAYDAQPAVGTPAPALDEDELAIVRPRRRWHIALALALSAATGAMMVLIFNRGKDKDGAGSLERPAASIAAGATSAAPPAAPMPVPAARVARPASPMQVPAAAGAAAGVASGAAATSPGLAAGGAAPSGTGAAPPGKAAPTEKAAATRGAPIEKAAVPDMPAPIEKAAVPDKAAGERGAPTEKAAALRGAPTEKAAALRGAPTEKAAHEVKHDRRAEKAIAERKQRDPGKPRRPAPERPRAAASAARDGGFLTVNADPYATVFVDGKKHGFTPVVRLGLPPGSHRLRLVSSNGQPDKKMRVQIASGQELRKFIKW